MSEIWCAQKVANLEGWCHIEASKHLLAKVMLENIDRRTRNLEQLYTMESPPPMLPVTWESLEYRLLRLDRRWTPSPSLLRRDHPISSPTSASDVISTIKTVLSTFCLPPWFYHEQDLLKEVDEKDQASQLVVLSQCLSWAAGRWHYRSPDRQEELSQLYAFAVELSIAVPTPEKSRPRILQPGARTAPSTIPRTSPPLPCWQGPPGAGVIPKPPVIRPICTRPGCLCSCHVGPGAAPRPPAVIVSAKPRSGSSSIIGWMAGKSKRKEREVKPMKRSGFGWLRKLWCFGKKKVDDSDSESESDVSSIFSSTIVDD